MPRLQSSAAVFGLSVVVVLIVLAFTVQVSGSPAPGAAAAPAVSSMQPETLAVADPGTAGPAFSDGETCRADAAADTVSAMKPPFRGKTCRCSCGDPCKTDADCGGAVGSCRAGITCC
jgi:hypothetical protein